jgi:GDPmannose 4,6-dehydratase
VVRSLILGVNGQDGSYLAEELLERGDEVTGVGRQSESRWVDPSRFRYISLDIADYSKLDMLLDALRPEAIYHLAASHGPAGHVYETVWRDALAVNLGTLHVCLEHLRARAPDARLFYPSSLKAFGDNPPPVITEEAARVSDCLYGVTKNAAYDLMQYYRARHNCWASVGFFFNHDSPRRPDNYFLPRLAANLAAQRRGSADGPSLSRLDFWCDWGDAREFMQIVADLMRGRQPHDLVFATGRPIHAATLADRLARAIGLNGGAVPAAEQPPFRADVKRMISVIGRPPQRDGFDVAAWILRERFGIEVNPRAKATA